MSVSAGFYIPRDQNFPSNLGFGWKWERATRAHGQQGMEESSKAAIDGILIWIALLVTRGLLIASYLLLVSFVTLFGSCLCTPQCTAGLM
jgi:hypothetical protein